MNISKNELAQLMHNERFPCSNKYDPEWMRENQMGPNAVWLTEWLCEEMAFEPGMRVLDMGCGRAMSSVFLAKEFGVQVWANDLWIEAEDNEKRVKKAGLEDLITCIHAEAHALPYEENFFDAIVSIDSYQYFGTDDCYLNYFLKFLKPDGQLGVTLPSMLQEFDEVPEHLMRPQKNGGVFWDPAECWCLHSLEWWQKHWARTGLVDMTIADTLEDGWKHWAQHERAIEASGGWLFPSDEEVLKRDQGKYIGLVRLVARRRDTS